MGFDATMNALAELKSSSYLSLVFEAEHTDSFPAGTVMSQSYNAISNRLTLTFSAGPEPAANAALQPIMLGVDIESGGEFSVNYIIPWTKGRPFAL